MVPLGDALKVSFVLFREISSVGLLPRSPVTRIHGMFLEFCVLQDNETLLWIDVRNNDDITIEGAELLTRAVMVKWLHCSLCTEQATHTRKDKQLTAVLCLSGQESGDGGVQRNSCQGPP